MHLQYLKVQRTRWTISSTHFDLHPLRHLTFLHFAPPLDDQKIGAALSSLTALKYLHGASHGITGETLFTNYGY
jgi:hypothetical protein